jgi:HlyD family secretion protein
MDVKTLKHLVLAAMLVLFLTACSGIGKAASGEPTPTPPPPLKADINVVSEGRVVPAGSVQLAFFTGGLVEEVLVEEGDMVRTSQVVARLGNRTAIESDIASAQNELLSAQQARQELFEGLPEQQTAALQAVKDAREGVRAAEQKLARRALEKAEEDFKPYRNKPEDDLRRAAFLNRLSEAQQSYDKAVRALNQMTGAITPGFYLEQAQTELAIAQARLQLAEEQHEKLKNGPDPDDLAAADARIKAAQASLANARAALAHLELLATRDGAVVALDLVAGEPVSAGEPVMRIADFSRMYVETDDLTEIEVVDIAIGQKVTIVLDALPDLELTGTVESINPVYEEKRGDITYTARILLDSVDPRLRWGMTVAITFIK